MQRWSAALPEGIGSLTTSRSRVARRGDRRRRPAALASLPALSECSLGGDVCTTPGVDYGAAQPRLRSEVPRISAAAAADAVNSPRPSPPARRRRRRRRRRHSTTNPSLGASCDLGGAGSSTLAGSAAAARSVPRHDGGGRRPRRLEPVGHRTATPTRRPLVQLSGHQHRRRQYGNGDYSDTCLCWLNAPPPPSAPLRAVAAAAAGSMPPEPSPPRPPLRRRRDSPSSSPLPALVGVANIVGAGEQGLFVDSCVIKRRPRRTDDSSAVSLRWRLRGEIVLVPSSAELRRRHRRRASTRTRGRVPAHRARRHRHRIVDELGDRHRPCPRRQQARGHAVSPLSTLVDGLRGAALEGQL